MTRDGFMWRIGRAALSRLRGSRGVGQIPEFLPCQSNYTTPTLWLGLSARETCCAAFGAWEKVNDQVDWENVAEEIEDVGRTEWSILKAEAWPSSLAVPGWRAEARGCTLAKRAVGSCRPCGRRSKSPVC